MTHTEHDVFRLPAPTFTVTRLGLVSPAVTLRFEVVGRSLPHGQTVT